MLDLIAIEVNMQLNASDCASKIGVYSRRAFNQETMHDAFGFFSFMVV